MTISTPGQATALMAARMVPKSAGLGRTVDAEAEQVCSFFAREILRLIEEALAARGESLSNN